MKKTTYFILMILFLGLHSKAYSQTEENPTIRTINLYVEGGTLFFNNNFSMNFEYPIKSFPSEKIHFYGRGGGGCISRILSLWP